MAEVPSNTRRAQPTLEEPDPKRLKYGDNNVSVEDIHVFTGVIHLTNLGSETMLGR